VNNLIGSGAEVFARSLDKDAEFEADRVGLVLAARAGYNPYALVEVLHKLAARGAEDQALALLFETHPAPNDRLTHLGDALSPRMAQLPGGTAPAIRQVSAQAPPAAATPLPAEGARALQQEEGTAPSPADGGGKGGVKFNPAPLLRGIFGQ
jgi:predicted Zn-dependent protease